jgi:hypothetical protein
MKKRTQLSRDHKNLIRRYLIWAYKSTKEGFERIERKTTQLTVDEFILDHLRKNRAQVPPSFKAYIEEKRRDELKLKYADAGKKKYHPQYMELKDRLGAVEASIKYFLGDQEMKRIAELYEKEFTRRILEAREH